MGSSLFFLFLLWPTAHDMVPRQLGTPCAQEGHFVFPAPSKCISSMFPVFKVTTRGECSEWLIHLNGLMHIVYR